MKKRLLSIILAVVLASGTIPAMTVPVEAEDAPPTQDNTTIASGNCGYKATWKLSSDGTLTISGTGSLYLTNVPWTNNDVKIKNVVIDNGITRLPSDAFNNCINLENVTLSNTLTEIPELCFYRCSSLEAISIPNCVQKIDDSAFSSCSSLKSISIPNGITNISWGCFSGCSALEKVTLPNTINEIETSAFSNCKKLKEINFPTSLTQLRTDAFNNCEKLENLDFSTTSLRWISDEAFNGCTSLKTIALPHTLQYIDQSAFSYCGNLKDVTFYGSSRQFSAIHIEDDNDAITQSQPKYIYTKASTLSLPETLTISSQSIPWNGTLLSATVASDATDPYVEWSLSPSDIVEIERDNNNSDTSIRIRPLKEGIATITAKTQDGSDLSATCTVTVTSPENYATVYFKNTNIQPQSVKKGEKISKPDDPQRDGYTFLGWSTDPNNKAGYFDFDNTIINNDIYLYPIWKDSKLHVNFETQGGTPIEMQRIDSGDKATKPSDPTWENYKFLGWTTDEANSGVLKDGQKWTEFDFSTKITQDTNLYSVWSSNVCQVTFYTNQKPYYVSINKGETLKNTDIPTVTRDGYTLLGWTNNGRNIIDLKQPITDNYLDLDPVWQKNTVDINLRADCPGEYYGASKVYPTQSVDRNVIFSQPEAPIIKGYSFVKWYVSYTDKNGKWAQYNYDFSKSVDDNINTIRALSNSDYFNNDRLELTAEMSQNSITVTYHLNGVGSKDVLTTKNAKYNGSIDKEIYPMVPGYAFLGWYTDQNCTTKEIDWTNVDKNLDLYAGWLKFADYSNSTSTQTEIKKVDDATIVTPKSDNGTTSVTEGKDKGKASITTNPSAGYETDKIRVIGEDGKEIPVKKIGDNTYSFDTQNGKVAVIATYKAKQMPFSDVSANTYFYKPVQWALENGITSGTSATAFSPNKPCKRSEMVTFLWRMAGSPKVSGNIQFNDIPNNAYYKDALLWAVQNGITSGKTSNTFAPNESCNRGQMATFLWRMKGKPESSGSTFEDVKNTDYYSTAISWLKSSGITAGKSKTSFDPTGDCTRGQMVTFLYRYSGNK